VSRSSAAKQQRALTLIELVVTLLLVGLLAVVAAPRFFSQQPFAARGFSDEVLAAVRYAHRLAVATGCDVQVTINPGQYVLNQRVSCTSGAFTQSVFNPGTSQPQFTGQPPTGVNLSAAPASFLFNALGRASSAATIDVGGRTFQVVQETGFVYEP
jgi:MSHA pilin protein MshC